jgi:hypothetical protein
MALAFSTGRLKKRPVPFPAVSHYPASVPHVTRTRFMIIFVSGTLLGRNGMIGKLGLVIMVEARPKG